MTLKSGTLNLANFYLLYIRNFILSALPSFFFIFANKHYTIVEYEYIIVILSYYNINEMNWSYNRSNFTEIFVIKPSPLKNILRKSRQIYDKPHNIAFIINEI